MQPDGVDFSSAFGTLSLVKRFRVGDGSSDLNGSDDHVLPLKNGVQMPVVEGDSVKLQKVCVHCGVEVTNQRRFKNPRGEYYCVDCYSANAASASSIPPAVPQPENGKIADTPDRMTARSHGLIPTLTCPHCWHHFLPQEVMWISAHSDLIGDAVLGPEKASRFLPTRYTVDGQAIDARGNPCQQLACPRCHLVIPRSVVESEPLFISMIGGPKTGKSYLLSSMTWAARNQFPSLFALSFGDADAVGNQLLIEYEETLFLPDDPDKLTLIAKTEEQGDLYDQANLGGHVVTLPRPFLFNVRPTAEHPKSSNRGAISRVVCMYDNAGESYQPGKDTMTSAATQHLAKAKVLIFLFDPTQDPRFRQKCKAFNDDPQLTNARGTQRQETLLAEAASRVRRYANLPPGKKHESPLLVLVPKSDVWGSMISEDLVSEPILKNAVGGRISAVDVVRIERVSAKLRTLLLAETPELVAAAEDFCTHVVYIPVSALGRSPENTPDGLMIRPCDIKSRWSAVPLLYLFAKWTTGLVAGNSATSTAAKSGEHPSGAVTTP